MKTYSSASLFKCLPTLAILLCSLVDVHAQDAEVQSVWLNDKIPVTFRLGHTMTPLFGTNNAVRFNKNDVRGWLGAYHTDQIWKALGNKYLYGFEDGCVRGEDPEVLEDLGVSNCYSAIDRPIDDWNGVNEIQFDYWEPRLNQGTPQGKHPIGTIWPKTDGYAYVNQTYNLPTMEEVDVYINTTDYQFILYTQREACKKSGSKNTFLLKDILLHELGHALGLGHADSPFAIMYAATDDEATPITDFERCATGRKGNVTSEDIYNLSVLYGGYQSYPMNINSPSEGQILYAGNYYNFSASAATTMQGSYLESNAGSGNPKPLGNTETRWSSDIDGEIGIGSNITVSQLSAGTHFITAKVGEPGEAVYGEDVVSIKYAADPFTNDTDAFHPLPCTRLVDNPSKCLIHFYKEVTLTTCPLIPSDPRATLEVYNLSTLDMFNRPTVQTTSFISRRNYLGCQDGVEDAWSWYIWLNEAKDEAVIDVIFDLNCSGESNNKCGTYSYRVGVHIVEATIKYEQPVTQCEIQPGETSCGVNFTWSDHFWAPESGIFHRASANDEWELLMHLGSASGSVDLPPFATESGTDQFAVFQYSEPKPAGYNIDILNVPDGLMAGPFTVHGQSDVDPLFMGKTVLSWLSAQDEDSDSWGVWDSGTTLNLHGNTWKAIDYNYIVTADTWLEVDYKSDGQDAPEIGGVTLLSSLDYSSDTTFQIHGTQTYGNQWFNRYFDDGWKTFRMNVGHVMKNMSWSKRNVKYLGFIGDIDASNKQINISYRNPRLFQKETTHLPQWGHSGNWYDPETSGQGFALEVNPINEVVVAEWFTYASDGHGKGASSNRWYMQSGSYDPYSSGQDSVTLDIYQVTGGRFNRTNTVTQKIVGTAKVRFFDCYSAHVEYDFYTGTNSGRQGYIPLTRLTPNIDCSVGEYSGPHKSDFGYTGNWYYPPTSGQGFAFELNPAAGVLVAQWFTYLPGYSSNLNKPDRQRWFSLVGDYTPGNPNSNSLTIYQSKRGALDDPYPVTTTPVGTANVVFTSCTTARINYSFSSNVRDFANLSGTIDLVRIASNVTCE